MQDTATKSCVSDRVNNAFFSGFICVGKLLKSPLNSHLGPNVFWGFSIKCFMACSTHSFTVNGLTNKSNAGIAVALNSPYRSAMDAGYGCYGKPEADLSDRERQAR